MRYFVYVNHNPDRKSIKVHCERNGPCGHILKQIIPGNVAVSCSIISLTPDKGVLKIGITDNSYWLLVWADSPQDAANNPVVKKIAQDFNISNVVFCSTCC